MAGEWVSPSVNPSAYVQKLIFLHQSHVFKRYVMRQEPTDRFKARWLSGLYFFTVAYVGLVFLLSLGTYTTRLLYIAYPPPSLPTSYYVAHALMLSCAIC